MSEVKDALAWWLEPTQRLMYPNLSLMAIDILSIPAMSAEPKRLFSGYRGYRVFEILDVIYIQTVSLLVSITVRSV